MGVMSRPSASTEALVLRCWPCGETSTIASLLTREHGFVKVIAKGARGPRSQLRPLIEPGRLVNVEFSLDARRELQYLRGGGVDLDPLAWDRNLMRVSSGNAEALLKDPPFEFPHDAVLHPNGNLYVSDGYAKALWQIDPHNLEIPRKLPPYLKTK